jgi:hypothetical protein
MTSTLGREPKNALTMRASDAERARAASTVDAAVADGRLTWTEHSERYDQIWSAQTRGELLPALADLGGTIDIPQVQRVTAVCSKVARAVSSSTQRLHAKATFGAVVLDLSAMRANQEILVHASSFCGKILIVVPDDATVVDEGQVFLGKRSALRTAPPPGGPVIRIDGKSSFGNLKVRRAGEAHVEAFEHPFAMGMGLGMMGQVPQHVHFHRDHHVHYHGHHDRKPWKHHKHWKHQGGAPWDGGWHR